MALLLVGCQKLREPQYEGVSSTAYMVVENAYYEEGGRYNIIEGLIQTANASRQ